MCTLPNYQTQDLKELQHQRKNQKEKTRDETIEMIVPNRILLSFANK
jgi:hypothetical protein